MRHIVFIYKNGNLLCKCALVLIGIVCCFGCSRSENYDRPQSLKNVDEIKSALGRYEVDIGTYPSTTDGLEALVSRPSAVPAAKWYGPYIPDDSGLKDPWGNNWCYRFPGSHKTLNGYDLYSKGPDGISKTEGDDPDDIHNW